jgi:ABC-type dipeptide/oligopeptide/nickel transport system permease subunit
LIISETRTGLTLDPWALIGPLVAIGFLTVGINLMLDGARRGKRRFGRDAVLDAEAVAT